LTKARNAVLLGPPGTGKAYLDTSLGIAAAHHRLACGAELSPVAACVREILPAPRQRPIATTANWGVLLWTGCNEPKRGTDARRVQPVGGRDEGGLRT